MFVSSAGQFPLTLSSGHHISLPPWLLIIAHHTSDTVYKWIKKTEVENVYLPPPHVSLCQASGVRHWGLWLELSQGYLVALVSINSSWFPKFKRAVLPVGLGTQVPCNPEALRQSPALPWGFCAMESLFQTFSPDPTAHLLLDKSPQFEHLQGVRAPV